MYILLPHLSIKNANAISSPLTWGFPSITAFLGAAHAIERKINDTYPIQFKKVGVVCHSFTPQVYKPAGKRENYFSLTRNPLDKDGSTKSIVEEGRAHFEISLLIEVAGTNDLDQDEREDCLQKILSIVASMRIAGGSVFLSPLKRHQAQFEFWPTTPKEHKKVCAKLLPGFALISQHQQFENYYQQLKECDQEITRVDALVDMCSLRSRYTFNEIKQADEWQFVPKGGWLVPIPVGYSSISPLYDAGEMKGCRDTQHPAAFVEAIYSLGEWRSPHRLQTIDEILWHYQATDNGLYMCINQTK